MAVLELTRDEEEVVGIALRTYESTLLLEIANADVRSFREILKRREELVHALLQRIRQDVPELTARR